MSLNDYTVWTCGRRYGRHRTPADIRSWLFDQGSLTKRLQSACPGKFRVEVLDQRYSKPYSHERQALSLPDGLWCFIRQVYLYCDQTPVVYARTVVPIYNLSGAERRLTRLGSRSLGGLLFSENTMRREAMQVAAVQKGQPLYQIATEKSDNKAEQIWGRRSVFYIHGKKLLVSEIFLPSITRVDISVER